MAKVALLLLKNLLMRVALGHLARCDALTFVGATICFGKDNFIGLFTSISDTSKVANECQDAIRIVFDLPLGGLIAVADR